MHASDEHAVEARRMEGHGGDEGYTHHHADGGGHAHHHHVDIKDTSGPRLLLTLGLNFVIPSAQIIGGLYANSVALISDATHNFSDFLAILISYVALRIGRRGASPQFTFGYRRAEIMAALINVVLLIGASIFIMAEALHRFHNPEAVAGRIVMALAAVGIAGNGFSAWLLHRDSQHSLNVRGAFLHMMGDLLTSVVVLINGLILLFKPWYWLDPLLSVLIVAFILKNCWHILKESSAVLMNAAPRGLDIEAVKHYLEQLPEIRGVHYLHAWNLSSTGVAFSCHVLVDDQAVSSTEALAEKIRHELLHRFHIDHPVLQFETAQCGNGGMLCEVSCAVPNPAAANVRTSRTWRLSRLFYHGVRLALGAIFVYASIDKIIHPQAFAEAIVNYQILPAALVNPAAVVLPWLEFIIGSLMIGGIWMPGAVVLATVLLTIFEGAFIFNIARGLDVYCGCFATAGEVLHSSAWYLARDSLFLAAAVYLLIAVFHVQPYRPSSGSDRPR
jgi:cation diffusion facilitator family transporter